MGGERLREKKGAIVIWGGWIEFPIIKYLRECSCYTCVSHVPLLEVCVEFCCEIRREQRER